MAGIGRPPKPTHLRQRRNKTVPGANLTTEEAPIEGAPELPSRGRRRRWHPRVLAWWQKVWQSPMAAEYLESDVEGLYLVAELHQQFWGGATKLAAEIRLQEQRFGLSPIDRRRLQWEVHRVETAEAKRPAPAPQTVEDTRSVLRVLEGAG